MLKSDGIAREEDWRRKLPDEKRRKAGPYVVIECYQQIPCNPCEKACPRKAVTVGEDINSIPAVDYSLCNGCGICIAHCPGVAIFVVDETYQPGYARVLLPWEYLPVPEQGDTVTALGRDGKAIGEAEVVEVRRGKNQDRTSVIGLKLPLEQANIVRGLKIRGEDNGS